MTIWIALTDMCQGYESLLTNHIIVSGKCVTSHTKEVILLFHTAVFADNRFVI